MSQVIVSLNAILFFFRLINYLTVWRALGVLYVILVQVSENVAVPNPSPNPNPSPSPSPNPSPSP